MKTFLRLLARLLWRFRALNHGVLNTAGPVLLIPNHQSMLDFLFLAVLLPDDWKFVASDVAAQKNWLHRRVVHSPRVFRIDTTSPYSLKRMAEYLANGGRLVLFAEGRLSRTGSLMKLFDGTGFLLHKTGAKIITCHLRGVERLPAPLTMHKNLKQWFPRITAHFSHPLTPPKLEHVSAATARATLTNWLRDRM